MKTIDFESEGNRQAYALLSSAIAPRPIAFASTIDQEGRVNLSPFSFFNVFGANPPTLVFAPVRSARSMQDKDTLLNVKEVPEVAISMVTYSMVEQMSLASTAYEKGVNEYRKSGFHEVPSEKIKPPYVKESPASFECRVVQIIETGPEGGAGSLVICEVLVAHVDEDFMKPEGVLDAEKLDLVGRMGENWYCRANGEALFEVEKPIRKKGIGVDALPDFIKESTILTGNHLGKLGNLERLPSDQEVQSSNIMTNDQDKVHQVAKQMIDDGEVMEALILLMKKKLNA
ncbi:flavin reductase family protein [Portibacter marinus]|uniref:flavin reductase family protein n=1 Tax=Portibacter marinus TaxID=2898660 RepID=UPI001F38C377|nr:flavin reductase family protein [Portibacter marinus]